MKHPKFQSTSALNSTYFMAALLLSAGFMGARVKADADLTVYTSETSLSTQAVTLATYTFDTTTDSVVGSPTGLALPASVFGGADGNESALELSGDGTMLSYSGFTNAAGAHSTEVLYNLSAGTFDASTTLAAGNAIRASFTESGATFYVANGTSSPDLITKGGTTETLLDTGTAISANSIAFNSASNNLYISKNSAGAGGIFTPSTNGAGLITAAQPFSEISGTGVPTDVINGLGFLGSGTIFAADSSENKLLALTNATPATINNWNLSFNLALSATSPIQQLSVVQTDANDALIFFTTGGLAAGTSSIGTAGTTTSTLDEVAFSSTTGFGTVTQLDSSTSDIFSGVAAIPETVPEPSTYALIGCGLGLMVMSRLLQRKAA
ncbi:MAG: PEP-CTERM sorting domain-containing protein [Verrucomicrobiota bacterium]